MALPDELDGNAQLIDMAVLQAGAVNETQLAQLQETFGPLAAATAADGGAGSTGKLVKRMVPRPIDGLVRQVDDKRVISHEEIKDYHETQDVKHLGDFTDEVSVKMGEGIRQRVAEGVRGAGQQGTAARHCGNPRRSAITTGSNKLGSKWPGK